MARMLCTVHCINLGPTDSVLCIEHSVQRKPQPQWFSWAESPWIVQGLNIMETERAARRPSDRACIQLLAVLMSRIIFDGYLRRYNIYKPASRPDITQGIHPAYILANWCSDLSPAWVTSNGESRSSDEKSPQEPINISLDLHTQDVEYIHT